MHPSVAEFANEQYVELSGVGIVGEWNTELDAPGDNCWSVTHMLM